MANFPPNDLLQSGYAFRKLIELVEQTKHATSANSPPAPSATLPPQP